MFRFNPLTGKLEIQESGYTGDLLDSHGNVLATVVNGIIKTVTYSNPSEEQGVGYWSIGSTFIIATTPSTSGIGSMAIGSTFIIA
jgi:hypothetical protein